MADFEEAPVAAFREVFGNALVSGCWFHYAQAVVKRIQKLGMRGSYKDEAAVRETIHCLLGLPLLPGNEITEGWNDIRALVDSNTNSSPQLRELTMYVKRTWLDRQTVGPERLSVRGNRSRTNNVLESYHAALRRRIKVAHPNLYTFLGHLSKATTDFMTDKRRIENGLNIRRPRKKTNISNEKRIQTCITKFDSGSFSRLQFLRAVSHSIGAHTDALQVTEDNGNSDNNDDDDNQSQQSVASTVTAAEAASTSVNNPASAADGDVCEVCLVASRARVALVPCGHSSFCGTCADTVTSIGNGCPICRTRIDMVLRLYN